MELRDTAGGRPSLPSTSTPEWNFSDKKFLFEPPLLRFGPFRLGFVLSKCTIHPLSKRGGAPAPDRIGDYKFTVPNTKIPTLTLTRAPSFTHPTINKCCSAPHSVCKMQTVLMQNARFARAQCSLALSSFGRSCTPFERPLNSQFTPCSPRCSHPRRWRGSSRCSSSGSPRSSTCDLHTWLMTFSRAVSQHKIEMTRRA